MTEETLPETVMLTPPTMESVLQTRKAFSEAFQASLIADVDVYKEHGTYSLTAAGTHKVAALCGISTKILGVTESTQDAFEVIVKVEARTVDGRISHESVASCSQDERQLNAYKDGKPRPKPTKHMIRAIAETRATKRAVSALVGIADFTPKPSWGGMTKT